VPTVADQYGYAGKILRVDLSSGAISHTPTEEYSDRFLGGRGIANKIYWDEVPADVSAFDPENLMIFATGPLAGFSGLAGSRWQVCGKAPAMTPEEYSYCNLGGRWGGQLKFAGYDALVVRGKADRPVYIFIEDNVVEIRDASALWGRSTVETRETLKSEIGSTFAVVACGPAGENLVSYAIILADNDASGSSGFGAVMGSKNLKTVAVRGKGKATAGDPDKLKKVRGEIQHILYKGPDYARQIAQLETHIEAVPGMKIKRDLCLGCTGYGGRIILESRDGSKRGKSLCGSSLFYLDRVTKYYGEANEVPFYVNRLCDEYGVDALAIESMMKWLSRCRHAGILTDENTGIPLSKVGSWEYMEARRAGRGAGLGLRIEGGTPDDLLPPHVPGTRTALRTGAEAGGEPASRDGAGAVPVGQLGQWGPRRLSLQRRISQDRRAVLGQRACGGLLHL
jgi:aldehyde:ferredoxin oxidoreductase